MTISNLIALLAFFLAFALSTLSTNLFVILLKGSKILASLGELTFLHTLTNIPVDKGTLGVPEENQRLAVILMV